MLLLQFGDNNSLEQRLFGFLSLCSSHQSPRFLIAHLLLTAEFFGIYEDMDSSCTLEVVPKRLPRFFFNDKDNLLFTAFGTIFSLPSLSSLFSPISEQTTHYWTVKRVGNKLAHAYKSPEFGSNMWYKYVITPPLHAISDL